MKKFINFVVNFKNFMKKKSNRIPLTEMIFTTLIIILAISTLRIMIFKAGEYRAMAENQLSKEVVLKAKRGRILDRNNKVLADSAMSYKVDADLIMMRKLILQQNDIDVTKLDVSTLDEANTKIVESYVDEISKLLAPYFNMRNKDMKETLLRKNEDGTYTAIATLGKKLEISTLESFTSLVNSKELNWINITEDTKRYYPNEMMASQVLGAVGIDNKGLTGAELSFNDELEGVNGLRITQRDHYNRDLMLSEPVINNPVDGNDVVLTIDENIQKIAEKVAKDALDESNAKNVVIIVSDPYNGEILAMVTSPGFNPNSPFEDINGRKYDDLWRNKAISNLFEPGSTFKIVTMAAVLNEEEAKLTDEFFCNGYIMVGNDRINCAVRSGHGHETLTDLMKNSCNPGFVLLGQRIGVSKFVEYVNKFGMDKPSGIDLPGEASGIIIDPEKASALDFGTASIGQTNAITALHIINNLNTVINKGIKTTPHILKKVVKRNSSGSEETIREYEIPEGERVITEDTAKKVLDMLIETAESGGSTNAKVEGYKVLGKTGTAEKINPETGKYEKYIASFVGAAPAENPKFSIYIAVDEPDEKYHYGGEFAAPKGKILFEEILKYYESIKNN